MKETILFVSHDHSFLQEIATCIGSLRHRGFISAGTYESYLDVRKDARAIKLPKTVNASAKAETPKTSKETYVLRKEIASTESKIARLEQEIEKLTAVFAQTEYGSAKWDEASNKLATTKKQLAELTVKWESLLQQEA